jgi:hypothetical protein
MLDSETQTPTDRPRPRRQASLGPIRSKQKLCRDLGPRPSSLFSKRSTVARVSVYDLSGARDVTLVRGAQSAGAHLQCGADEMTQDVNSPSCET